MEARIGWKPFYSVGDAALDGEHKRLLGVIEELRVAVAAGDEQARVKDALDRLTEYTMSHFEHEEQALRQCGYPQFEAHKKLHDAMRERTLAFQADVASVSGNDLLNFMKSWWIRHIQNQDRAYAPYLDVLSRQPVKMV
jgi:hemerythrin